MRLLATAELDQGFDGDSGNAHGLVTTLMSAAGPGQVHGLTVDSKQRIVLAGRQDASTKSYFALARYQPVGKLDQSFNGGRLVDPGSGIDSAEAVTTQDDGTIVAAGSPGAYPNRDTVVARYAENGAPDGAFGSSGRTQIDVGADDTALGIALQPGTRSSSRPRATRRGPAHPARRGRQAGSELCRQQRAAGPRDHSAGPCPRNFVLVYVLLFA